MADFGESQEEETERQMIYEGGDKNKSKTPDIMSADGGRSARSHKSAKPLSQMGGSAKGSNKGRTPS